MGVGEYEAQQQKLGIILISDKLYCTILNVEQCFAVRDRLVPVPDTSFSMEARQRKGSKNLTVLLSDKGY